MKTMYRINIIFLSINIILFVNPYWGLLFMIPLGILQVISSFWLLTQEKRTSRNIQWMTTTHLVLSFIVLGMMFAIGENWEWIILIGMICSGFLAFFFMFLSYTCYMESKRESSVVI